MTTAISCAACAGDLVEGDKFCPSCGHEVLSSLIAKDTLSALLAQSPSVALTQSASEGSHKSDKSVSENLDPRNHQAVPIVSAGKVETTQSPRTLRSPVDSTRKNPPLWALVTGLVAFIALAAYWAGRQSTSGNPAHDSGTPIAASAPSVAPIALQVPAPPPISELPQSASNGDTTLATNPAAGSASAPSIAETVVPAPAEASAPEVAVPPMSPSFDCVKATSVAEKLVCANEDLAKADVQLNLSYKAAIGRNADPTRVRREQFEWLRHSRNSCADVECVRRAYEEREAALAKESQ
jgi:uncharacterized protein YecT (DUF1311 family)